MKRAFIRILILCLALMLTAASALAAAPATLNQKMALRTGPNTGYAEMFTLPQSTEITAIEYEEGNGVTWVLVEFEYDGLLMRGYTGLKRMTVHGEIPWASHEWGYEQCVAYTEVFAAPDPAAAVRGELNIMEEVSLLRFDGEYVYIEYTDFATGELSRGWVPEWALGVDYSIYFGNAGADEYETPVLTGDASISMRCSAMTTLYSMPDFTSAATLLIPENAVVQCYGYLFSGFYIVEYNGSLGYVHSTFLSDY